MITTAWSIFAYIWLFLILVVISPNVVTLWEAIITLLCFPLLAINSYMTEKYFYHKPKEISAEEEAICKISVNN